MRIYSTTTLEQILIDLATREPETAAALEQRLQSRLGQESRDRVRETQSRQQRTVTRMRDRICRGG